MYCKLDGGRVSHVCTQLHAGHHCFYLPAYTQLHARHHYICLLVHTQLDAGHHWGKLLGLCYYVITMLLLCYSLLHTQLDAGHHWGRLLGRVQQRRDGEGAQVGADSGGQQPQGAISAEEHDAAAMRACAALVSEARSRWESEYSGQYIDDISAVVVLLHAQTNHQHQQQLTALS